MAVDVIPRAGSAPDVAVSLRDYVDNRCNSLHLITNTEIKRLEDVNTHLRASMLTEKESVARQVEDEKAAMQRQFLAIAESTRIATTALDKRLEGMNEFRQQMNDWAGRFITRQDVDSSLKYIGERVSKIETQLVNRQELASTQSAMNERVSMLEKFANNFQGRMWVIAAVMVTIELVLRFLPSVAPR